MINLSDRPFFLDSQAIAWVEKTMESMTVEEKVGQLFIHSLTTAEQDVSPENIDRVTNRWKVGGVMFRQGPKAVIQRACNALQEKSRIPALIAANLDSGGDGMALEGTRYGVELGVAATNDPEMARTLGQISAAEGKAMGCNWTFAPVVDIDYNWRNPITNIRTFGSDPQKVADMASAFIHGVSQYGVGTSIKHFPGDGVDERDQHLLTTVNSMSADEWMDSFGYVYRRLINENVPTVMVGHIMQPAWQKKLNPQLKDRELLPASLSRELLQGLLREELGFNGLIITDASQMLGFTTAMPRWKAVPYSIEAGCDMFLFGKCFEEDLQYMLNGLENGILSPQRLDESVTRILAFKAFLGLHKAEKRGELIKGAEELSIVGCEKHRELARKCADRAVTLVRDEEHLLPLTPQRYRRILLIMLGNEANFMQGNDMSRYIETCFNKSGFAVEVFDGRDTLCASFEDYKSRYDAVVYVANITTASNQTMVRINWIPPVFADGPFFSADIPTFFISLSNPYHYVDIPSIGTIINAYTANEATMDAVMEKLLGNSEFYGVSPVNPYGDRWVPAEE